MAAHVLGVVRSHYPGISLQRLEVGVANDIDHGKANELRLTSQERASKIIADVDLHGEAGESSQQNVI